MINKLILDLFLYWLHEGSLDIAMNLGLFVGLLSLLLTGMCIDLHSNLIRTSKARIIRQPLFLASQQSDGSTVTSRG